MNEPAISRDGYSFLGMNKQRLSNLILVSLIIISLIINAFLYRDLVAAKKDLEALKSDAKAVEAIIAKQIEWLNNINDTLAEQAGVNDEIVRILKPLGLR
jgi:hypothetical protein